jgi:hypothetical protein
MFRLRARGSGAVVVSVGLVFEYAVASMAISIHRLRGAIGI